MFANIQLMSMFGIAGIIEIVGGTLLTVGLFTRAVAFIMSGEMAVAYWYYANRPARGLMPIVSGGTLEVIYCFVFFYFVFAGPGPWSIDETRHVARAARKTAFRPTIAAKGAA